MAKREESRKEKTAGKAGRSGIRGIPCRAVRLPSGGIYAAAEALYDAGKLERAIAQRGCGRLG